MFLLSKRHNETRLRSELQHAYNPSNRWWEISQKLRVLPTMRKSISGLSLRRVFFFFSLFPYRVKTIIGEKKVV